MGFLRKALRMDKEATDCSASLSKAPIIDCKIFAYSTSKHLSQLYTGFSLLAKEGHIKLRQESSNLPLRGVSQKQIGLHGLFVAVNDKLFYYDLWDHHKLNTHVLGVTDVYFKRSYLESGLEEAHTSKVHPLGLNYEIYIDSFDYYELQRLAARYNHPRGFAHELVFIVRKGTGIGSQNIPTLDKMWSKPSFNQQPKVLFSVLAWNPDELAVHAKAEREEREVINATRARCIELLGKEFGKNFYGGFAHSDYARKLFPKLLLPDQRTFAKETYIRTVRQYPICVATTGLHGSIGWKMGEYVAFSRAIVSERLNYSVPGNFSHGRNYLEFATPEQCMEQTVKLFADRHLQDQMMENNWKYYQSYMRPDRLVWRSLMIGLT